jgi:hypothetical protein
MTVGTQHTHDRAAEYCEHLLTARAPQRWPALVEFFAPPDPTLAPRWSSTACSSKHPEPARPTDRATLDRVLGPTP